MQQENKTKFEEEKKSNILRSVGTSLVVQWLTPHSQYRGPRFDPWPENSIPHASIKDPASCN